MTEEGLVLEGTQTNFFAVEDNTLYTAKEGVLMGTVRGVVLEVINERQKHVLCVAAYK